MMSLIDSNILQFDVWETMDPETMELAQTSDFWMQAQIDGDQTDVIPQQSFTSTMQDNDLDWRIADQPDELYQDNIVHHDCMWAGSCVDAFHPGNTFVSPDMRTAVPGQSLLRRDTSPPRPDTPPSLDGDEAPQFRHAVDVAGTALRLLRDSAAVAADHSYTSRQNIDNLGVQTPSDSCESEEEIDVVSLGTSHQPLASSPQIRVDCSPRTPSHEKYHSQRSVDSVMSPRPVARKRLIPPTSIPSASVPRQRRGRGRRGRSNTDTDSEAESPEIERRSIHNDMERLRRIGLKNLFDELKKQIPATKDKERAPKVVILREAAALCRKLREEDVERERLRKQQNKLLAKLKKLRTSLAGRYRPY